MVQTRTIQWGARLIFWGVVAVIVLFLGWLFVVPYLPPQWRYRSEIHRTEAAIAELDQYSKEYGAYPTEAQFPLSSPDMFYVRLRNGYEVGFSAGFDESYWYDSRSKKWSYDESYVDEPDSPRGISDSAGRD
ncbi:MAG TPA: hypothetical protein VKC56_08360 [Gallionellaceae bacterium]|nr:hypothetical protein [Gallionellaceae bacterium]